MSQRISHFRSPVDAEHYYEVYDSFVAGHWPVPSEELDLSGRFGITHVRRSGPAEGTPIVLIHPTSGSSLGWYSLVAPLAAHHPVLTSDTIGTIGRSIQTAPVRSVTELSGWLDDTLSGLGLERIHLVGYSEGGWIAAAHAALSERRERLATVTLIEPAGSIERIPRRVLATMIARGASTLLARDKPQAIREFSRWLSGDVPLTDDEVELVMLAFRTFRQKLPAPLRLTDDQLRAMNAPTLLLLGAETRLCDPAKVAERARRLIQHVTVEITPGAGHGLPFQNPEQVTARILEFVDAADDLGVTVEGRSGSE